MAPEGPVDRSTSWWPGTPVGNADPLLLTYLLVVGAHMGAEDDMAAALDMVTVAPARILGRLDHGLAVGCRADLVVLEASTLAEAVGGIPARFLVVKDGRVTVSAERATALPLDSGHDAT